MFGLAKGRNRPIADIRAVQKSQIPPQAGSLQAYLRLFLFLVTQHARLLQEPTESLQVPFVSRYGTG